MQIMITYNVYKHFRSVLKDCKELTKERYPNLFANTIETGKKGKNVSKMTSKSQRLIIIFLVRLHYSVLVYNTASKLEDEPEKQFDFITFPQLEECLDELEGNFGSYGGQPTGKSEDASSMIENCRRKLKLVRSKLILQLDEIDAILAKIPKPKKKKTDGPLLVDQQLLMKMLTQFSASQQTPKKKRKRRNVDDMESEEEEMNDDSES